MGLWIPFSDSGLDAGLAVDGFTSICMLSAGSSASPLHVGDGHLLARSEALSEHTGENRGKKGDAGIQCSKFGRRLMHSKRALAVCKAS